MKEKAKKSLVTKVPESKESKMEIEWEGIPKEVRFTTESLKLYFESADKKYEDQENVYHADLEKLEKEIKEEMGEVFQNSGGMLQTNILMYQKIVGMLVHLSLLKTIDYNSIIQNAIMIGETNASLEKDLDDVNAQIRQQEQFIGSLNEQIKEMNGRLEESKNETLRAKKEFEIYKMREEEERVRKDKEEKRRIEESERRVEELVVARKEAESRQYGPKVIPKYEDMRYVRAKFMNSRAKDLTEQFGYDRDKSLSVASAEWAAKSDKELSEIAKELEKTEKEAEIVEITKEVEEIKKVGGGSDYLGTKEKDDRKRIDEALLWIVQQYPNENDPAHMRRRAMSYTRSSLKKTFPDHKDYIDEQREKLKIIDTSTLIKGQEEGKL